MLEEDGVEPEAPTNEARYRLLGEIARGGMGAVLEVRDESLGRTVAMKVVRADGVARPDAPPGEAEQHERRLLSEARILAQLDHPGVVAIHELGRDPRGRAFFTMKRVHGHDFGLVIEACRRGEPGWTLARAVGVLVRACEALAYAHQKGVVHRDLKPANLMVGRFGEVFVMDWGLARVAGCSQAPPVPVRTVPPVPGCAEAAPATADSVVRTAGKTRGAASASDTQAGAVLGTPGYMAPEQARAEPEGIGPRTDVYAIGAILYHLLAGRHPYEREPAPEASEAVEAILSGPPEPLAGLAPRAPEELVAIAEKAMARAPEGRYPSMLALIEDLEAWLEGRVVRAHRSGAWAELEKWIGRNRGAAAAVLAVVLGLAATVWLQAQRRVEREAAHKETLLRAEALRHEDARNRVALASAALSNGEISHMRALLEGCPEDLRGFEWRHLWKESDTSARSFRLEGLDLRSVLPLPGRPELLVAGAGSPHRLLLLEAASGTLLRELELGPESSVNHLSLSADGTRLAAFVHLGDLRLWDTRTWQAEPALDVRMHGWHGVAFAPAGALLAAFGSEGVELWDAGRRERLARLSAGQRDIADVAWTPDGERLFAASWDGSVSVWDARTHALLGVLRDSRERVQRIEVSPDGRWLAGGNWDSRLFVWDAHTLALVQRSDRLGGQVLALAWSPDSRLVAVGGGGGGGVVRLFEAGSWERVGRLVGEAGRVNALRFSADGRALHSGSSLGIVRTWELSGDTGRTLFGAEGSEPPSGVAFAPDGERAAVGWQSGVLELWDRRTRRCLASLRPGVRIRHLDWSRDGRQLALADWEEGILVLKPDSGAEVARLALAGPTEVHFAPDGARLAAASSDGRLCVWSLPRGALAWEQDLAPASHGWPGDLFGASWSPDGSQLAACNFDGTLEVRDARTGARLRTTQRPGMLFAQFAPDGESLLLAGYSGNRGMELLDARTLAPRWTSQPTSHLWPVLSPDGERVFTGNWSGFLGVWDARSGALLCEIEGLPPGNPRLGVAPTGDGVLLAAGKYLSWFEARE